MLKKIIIATVTVLATAAVATLAYNHFAEESVDSSATDDSVESSTQETTTEADVSVETPEIQASDIM